MVLALAAGAMLQCDQGQIPGAYMVPSPMVPATENAAQIGTAKDAAGFSNIPSFGQCDILTKLAQGIPVPCAPMTSTWVNTSTNTMLNGVPVATMNSRCSCAVGGTVTVSAPGMTLVNVM